VNPDHRLDVTIDISGVFVHFKASDGTEARMNIVEVAKDLGPGLGTTLARWCEDRIEEQSADKLPSKDCNELLAQIRLMAADGNWNTC